MDPISDTKRMIPNGTYAGRQLLSMLEGMIELNQFEVDDSQHFQSYSKKLIEQSKN